ncbi:hypothetical protein ACU21_01550 [Actinobaculum suis]|uniref:type IV secretory system conjugative DNA transfer family protein n=1 Tax=Actinobaculum suis TaxID=1657 RepID=UPI00080876AF|nr:type IV secretory system conjugative DNA transfer family protein [Actinobaculum suis]OCA93159.1 hypothetical protein ACU21_01550 [Actinobaculum suis]
MDMNYGDGYGRNRLVDVSLAAIFSVALFFGILAGVLKLFAVFAAQEINIDFGTGLAILKNPGSPGAIAGLDVNPGAYWAVVVGVLVLVVAIICVGLKRWRVGVARRRRDPEYNKFLASRSIISKELSGKALMKKAWLRPAKKITSPSQVGWKAGTSRGVGVWIPNEEATAVAVPARAGKGRYIVLPWLCEFDGAVVSTSTRAENLLNTWQERAKRGPIGVFAPLGFGNISVPIELERKLVGFSLTDGCADIEVAARRAKILAGGRATGVKDADFWEGRGRALLTPLLMAADISGEGAKGLARWSKSPEMARDALSVLEGNTEASLIAEDLRSVVEGDDWKTVTNQWMMVRQALELLDRPSVLDAVSSTSFSIDKFLASSGTFYIVLPAGVGGGGLASIILEEFYRVAQRRAENSVGGRCEPPVHLSLDEIANIGKPPSLLHMATAGGGSGIQALIVLQSRQQARAAWGAHYADALWDAVTTKIVLGGVSDTDLLESVSKLAGEHDEQLATRTYRGLGVASESDSVGVRRLRNITADQIRNMPEGRGLLVRKATPVAPLTLQTREERMGRDRKR